MPGFTPRTSYPRPDYSACSGCSLCLLVCPVWRSTSDLALTPHGRAKALQHGAGIADIASSIESCTLCGACEPVCPEAINLVGMIVDLRHQLPRPAMLQALRTPIGEANMRPPTPAVTQAVAQSVFLPGMALRSDAAILARATVLLESTVVEDDGADIALALETGTDVPALRLEQFLGPLRRQKSIIVGDGLLLRHLVDWLPRTKIVSLGAALSRLSAVRRDLRVSDLYVIEPRAYHADYARLVRHYDRLRAETGCTMNLDLQRIAIPATARNLLQRLGLEAADDGAQARWILHRRNIRRIVVENLDDVAAFEQVCDWPVVHVAELADDGKMNRVSPS